MKIQSFIDVITNSSTSVFTWADNIEGVKRVINGALKAANSEYTCDDLFNITIEWEENALSDYEDYQMEVAEEHISENPELDKLFTEYRPTKDWNLIKDIQKAIIDIASENSDSWDIMPFDTWVESCNNDWGRYKYSSSYVITPKDPGNEEAAKMVEAINGLFNYDASYC